MAGPQQLKVAPYVIVLAALTVAAYAAIFLLGLSPKLGLDLRGGTSVILTPVVRGGGQVNQDQLNQAVEIIRQRVNGTGVAEAEVTTQGQNIVVNVPNAGRDIVNRVGSTALLAFRPVLQAAAGSPTPVSTATPQPSASAGAAGSAAPSAPAATAPSASAAPTASASASATAAGRAMTGDLLAAGSASPSASPSPSAVAGAGASTAPSASASPAPSGSAAPVSGDALTSGAVVTSAAQLGLLDCSSPKALEGGSVNAQAENYDKAQIVACSRDGLEKYLLGPVAVQGTDVNNASATLDTQALQGWTVNLSFTGSGQNKFTTYTQNNVGNRFAIVLDGLVVSAPTINTAIPGNAQITGSFTQTDAQNLANVLKYGALPLSFSTSQAETISPTLGQDQLNAGLLAGGIGLALVVVYSLLYYRGLGLITIASLLVAASVTYASVVLLGEYFGFTLTLAGIAGLIVSIGITADSFVVYYERVKDEVREGRRLRSAADRGWLRAKRTILSADAVSFIAAFVLYFLSVGAVRGFAFTLGLTTLVDIAVVFMFTRPMVSLIARSKRLSSPRFTGLGTAHPTAAAAAAGANLPRAATREQRAASTTSTATMTDTTEG